MFRATFRDPITFRKIIDSVKELVKSAQIDFTPHGIYLQSMDSSHIALVSLQLNENAFTQYFFDKNFSIHVSIQRLSSVLKFMVKQDIITLSCNSFDPTQLQVKIQNPTRQCEFKIVLEHYEKQNFSIPQGENSAKVSLSSQFFALVCKQFSRSSQDSKFFQQVQIAMCKNYLKFCYSSNHGSGSVYLQSAKMKGDKDQVILQISTPVQQRYSAKYLSYLSKSSCLNRRIILKSGIGKPLNVQIFLQQDIGMVQFYLAPKVQ